MLVARSEPKLHELCDELMLKHKKITAHYVALGPYRSMARAEKLFDETEQHGFEVDWLINNAGFGGMGDFAKLDLDHALGMISLNVAALVALTHCTCQAMRERRSGKIINVSSAAGFQPCRSWQSTRRQRLL